MRILFVLSLIIFTLFVYNLCFLEGNLKVAEPYSWDFGGVREGDILEHSFTLKNDSASTLIINQLQTSCGCIESVVSTYQVHPGKASQIKVTFNTKGYSGKVEQFVYVHTSDPQKPITRLRVRAEIIKNK